MQRANVRFAAVLMVNEIILTAAANVEISAAYSAAEVATDIFMDSVQDIVRKEVGTAALQAYACRTVYTWYTTRS
jgi:hypothetical protein